MLGLNICILFSSFIFLLGLYGIIVNKRNLIVLLMSLELMLVGINLNFIFFSLHLDDIMGQVFSLYVLTVAAAESAIGLAIFITYFHDKNTLFLDGFIRGRG